MPKTHIKNNDQKIKFADIKSLWMLLNNLDYTQAGIREGMSINCKASCKL